MALQDILHLLPRIVLGKTTTKNEIIEHIKDRTGLHESDVVAMSAELKDTMLNYVAQGRPVKLEGIGTFTPTIKLNGKLKINFRLDKDLVEKLNSRNVFIGEIRNRENIGMTMAELEETLTAAS